MRYTIRLNTAVVRICGLIGFVFSLSFVVLLIKDFYRIGIHSNAEVFFTLCWVAFCLFSLIPLLFKGKIKVYDSSIKLFYPPRFIKRLSIKDIEEVHSTTINLKNLNDLSMILKYGCFTRNNLYVIYTKKEKYLISIDKRDLRKWKELLKTIREQN